MAEESEPVPAVDPPQLREALGIVFPTVPRDDRGDLHEVLDGIVATLKVDRRTVIALFKRAIALSA